jgi:ribose/xylose/arabinose/galactoside ABC-type transport system permease subunit
MNVQNNNLKLLLLKSIPFVLFVFVFVLFGFSARNWYTIRNFENIIRQSSYIGILAAGMTFVLLTGGVDLSVGANMFLSGSIAGLLIARGTPTWLGIAACLLVGTCFGTFNAFFIVKLKVLPFVVTLATLTAGRGLTLIFTRSVAVDLPPALISGIGSGRFLGIPYSIIFFGVVLVISSLILKYTPLGRQIYAVGHDTEAAKKAGIRTERVLAFVYIFNGFLAALAAIVSVSQIGNITAGFGVGDEFDAISASVLGGTSMSGGVGTVFPGAFIGTLLVQMVEAGLVYMQVDLYIQPLVSALVILTAVFLDSIRTRFIHRLEQRNIRNEETS